jgi:hypothetical protein
MADDLSPSAREVHPTRFRIAYIILAVVVGAAVGTFIVLVGRGNHEQRSSWSVWQPDGSSTQKTAQIANFVGRQYRLPSGRQLVVVIPGAPEIQNLPVQHVAFVEGNTPFSLESVSNSVMYQLCGLGERCAIEEGTPSFARGALLHREALELSLYTFKYADADSVVTLLPGRAGTAPSYAVYLRKDDFKNALDRPLSRTLRPTADIKPGQLTRSETNTIQSLDLRHLYRYSFQQAPDGSAILVLSTPSP